MAAETSPATGVRAVFSYEGENHRIRVDPAHGFNALLSLVAARVLSRSGPAAAAAAVAAGRVRIKYREEDTGLTFVLGPDDDLHELFAAPRVWAVDLAPQVPGAAAPVRNQAPPVRSWRAVVRRPWHCQQDLGEHIFFISYRKASESTCAELLALKIEVELFKEKVRRAQQSPLELAPTSPTSDDTPPPHPFLDVNCLRLGESWEAGFVTGLTGSAIVILLCSDLGMAHMRRADREEDNVLLEWEIALELKQERGIPILPIFLSVPTPNGATPFSMFGAVNTFPDELHAHRLSPRRQTVRQTIQEIFALQGTEVSPRDYKRIADMAIQLKNRHMRNSESQLTVGLVEIPTTGVDIVPVTPPSSTEPQSVGTIAIEQLAAALPPVLRTQDRLALLEVWLRPKHSEMERERQRLLRPVLRGTRDWLAQEVLHFAYSFSGGGGGGEVEQGLDGRSSQILWLQGADGSGKSTAAALAATELHARGLLAGVYFATPPAVAGAAAPFAALAATLAYGLARLSIPAAEALDRVRRVAPDVLLWPPAAAVRTLLVEPLAAASAEGRLRDPVVFVVDGVDEHEVAGFAELLQAFSGDRDDDNDAAGLLRMPRNVKLIVTWDSAAPVAPPPSPSSATRLELVGAQNAADLAAYAEDFLVAQLAGPATTIARSATELVARARGVFLRMAVACRQLAETRRSGALALKAIEDFPDAESPDTLFLRVVRTAFDAAGAAMEAVMREVLTVLVAAREPLPIDQIQLRCLHADEAQVRSAVRALGVLLVMEPETKTVSFCHWSVREFFVHGRAGPFRVAVQGEAVADDLSEASAPPYSLEDVTPAAPPVTFSNPYKWTTLVDNNWTCQLHAQNHPFFISYRREADRDAAVALKPMLQLALDAGRQGAPPPVGSRHPFFDDDCISFVGEWVPKWISAVFHAKVFVLLFSERTLQRMQNADKRSDGVLLEWEIALILQQEGRSAILPLFLAAPGSSATHSAATSSSSSTSVSNNPIFAIDLDRFPDSPHADPLSPGQRSVRGTVAKILFDSRATVVDPRNSADMNRAVTAASELLKQLESA